MGNAAQIGDQALQGVVVRADLLALILLCPVLGLGTDQCHQLFVARQPEIELGGQPAKLLWDRQFV